MAAFVNLFIARVYLQLVYVQIFVDALKDPVVAETKQVPEI